MHRTQSSRVFVGSNLDLVLSLHNSGPARFAARDQEHRVVKGRALSLACRAEGDPPIEYTWTRRGTPLSPDSRSRYVRVAVSEKFWRISPFCD